MLASWTDINIHISDNLKYHVIKSLFGGTFIKIIHIVLLLRLYNGLGSVMAKIAAIIHLIK